ncbi:hypothetical protein MTO96_052390 [Rhipicephalus appendiculatus]
MPSTTASPPSSASRLPTPRVRFSAADDLILVGVVAEIRPMSDPSRWQEVAKIVQEKTGKLCSARRARERFDLLLVQFRRKDNENRRKSGVEEDFGDLDQLLQELSDYARDCGYKPRAVDRQRKQQSTAPSAADSESPNSSTRRVATQSLRMKAAADRLAVSTTTYAAVSAAAADNHPELEDPDPELTAQDYLLSMYSTEDFGTMSEPDETCTLRPECRESGAETVQPEDASENPGTGSSRAHTVGQRSGDATDEGMTFAFN